MNKPILGISMGDPFGNGPEITVKALADKTIYDRCRPLVVGDVSSMEYAAKVARKVSGIDMKIRPIKAVSEANYEYGVIDVYDMGIVKASDIPGDPENPKPFGLGATALGGEAAFQYVVKVIELGFDKLPICMAKTQYSFSDDAAKLGAPKDFTITVRNLKVSAGAGFLVALTGDIMTMPGLPKVPAAEKIDVDENGKITGLF